MTKDDREHIAAALEALANVAQGGARYASGALPPNVRHVIPLEAVDSAVRHLRESSEERPLQWSVLMVKSLGPGQGERHYVLAKTPIGEYEVEWWENMQAGDGYDTWFWAASGSRPERLTTPLGRFPESLAEAQAVAQTHFEAQSQASKTDSSPYGTSTISDVRVPEEQANESVFAKFKRPNDMWALVSYGPRMEVEGSIATEFKIMAVSAHRSVLEGFKARRAAMLQDTDLALVAPDPDHADPEWIQKRLEAVNKIRGDSILSPDFSWHEVFNPQMRWAVILVPHAVASTAELEERQQRDEAREILEDLLNAAHRGVYSDGFTREAVRRAERLLAPPEWSELDNEAWLEARKQHALMTLEEKGGAPVRGTP